MNEAVDMVASDAALVRSLERETSEPCFFDKVTAQLMRKAAERIKALQPMAAKFNPQDQRSYYCFDGAPCSGSSCPPGKCLDPRAQRSPVVSRSGPNAEEIAAFEQYISTLPTPMQINMRDSMKRGESVSWQIWLAAVKWARLNAPQEAAK